MVVPKKKANIPDSSFALFTFKAILDAGQVAYREMNQEDIQRVSHMVEEPLDFSLTILTNHDDILIAASPAGYFIVCGTYVLSLVDDRLMANGKMATCFMSACHWLSRIVSGGLSIFSISDSNWYWMVSVAKEEDIFIGGGRISPNYSKPSPNLSVILAHLLENKEADMEFSHIIPLTKSSAHYLVLQKIEKFMEMIKLGTENLIK